MSIFRPEMVVSIADAIVFNDIHAKHGVEIQIRHDGLVVWINVDGVCVARVLTNGLTCPITVSDDRIK